RKCENAEVQMSEPPTQNLFRNAGKRRSENQSFQGLRNMSMINENNIIEWAERFLAGKLHADEKAIIKALPESDPALHRRWLEQVAFMRTMAALEERNDMRNLISSVAAQTDS